MIEKMQRLLGGRKLRQDTRRKNMLLTIRTPPKRYQPKARVRTNRNQVPSTQPTPAPNHLCPTSHDPSSIRRVILPVIISKKYRSTNKTTTVLLRVHHPTHFCLPHALPHIHCSLSQARAARLVVKMDLGMARVGTGLNTTHMIMASTIMVMDTEGPRLGTAV